MFLKLIMPMHYMTAPRRGQIQVILYRSSNGRATLMQLLDPRSTEGPIKSLSPVHLCPFEN